VKDTYTNLIWPILKTCTFILPASNWCNNPTQWPEVSYPDIYLYLIESPGKPVNDIISFFKVKKP